MAFKTLTITDEAYRLISLLKGKDESFSKLFLRISQEKINTASRFLGTAKLTPEESAAWKMVYAKNKQAQGLRSAEKQKRLNKRMKVLGL